MRLPRTVAAAALSTLAVAAAGAGAVPHDAAAFTLSRVASGFQEPLFVTSAPNAASPLYVVERAGRIKAVAGGRTTTVLDLTAKVHADGQEEGLLSMAVAPDGRYFVAYTIARPGGREGNFLIVEQRRLGGDVAHEVLRVENPFGPFQNGGQVAIGPDGLLWVAVGDGGGPSTIDNPAGRTDNLHGKLLRVAPNVDAPGYTIPPDNPFADGRGGLPEIWASGLRNPWRFSFDRATGDLVLGDVGAQRREEIDVARTADGRGRGATFGWPRFEGGADLSPRESDPVPASYLPPRFVHLHADGWTAITGGYVIRDSALAERGRYVYADYGLGRIFVLDLDCPTARPERATAQVDALASFGEDAQGHVYAVSIANGTVDRLVAGGAPGAAARCTPAGPTVSLAGTAKTQRVLAGREVRLRVRARSRITAHVAGRVQIGSRTYALATESGVLPAGRRTTVRLAAGPTARAAIRRALRRGTRVTATLTIDATAASGATSRRTIAVRVRG